MTALAFLGTRLLAQRLEEQRRGDAERWFARGQQAMAQDQVEQAIADFRQADLKRPSEKSYVLRYAEALARGRQTQVAQRALLALREASPDDSDINLALARLEDIEGDQAEATRYYRNALYAPWSDVGARRAARLEFIRFLLRHGSSALAKAELLAVSDDLPDTVAAHVETGGLFSAAGDTSAALDQYTRALRLDPQDRDANLGAGRAAFALMDYTAARRYLRGRAVSTDDKRRLDVTDLILSQDPLAARVPARERVQRMRRLLDSMATRLDHCEAAADTPVDGQTLEDQVRRTVMSLARLRSPGDAPLEDALVLAARAAREATSRCGMPTPTDDAILAMNRLHALEER